MASIETRTDSRGNPTYRVKFRHASKQRSRSFTTRDAATRWMKLLDAAGSAVALAHLESQQTPQARTVPDQLAHHIEHLAGVTDGTRATYARIADRISPWFGDTLIAAVDRDMIARWVNDTAATGLSAKTLRNRHSLLSAAFASAHRDGLIDTNPCKGVRIARTTARTEMCFLEPGEFTSLLAGIPQHYQALVLTLVGTGMRFGEATALQVRDVDQQTNSIRIRQAWKATDTGQRVLGPPKSPHSLRTIAAPAQVTQILTGLCIDRAATEFVFTNTEGGVIKQHTFWRNAWLFGVAALAGDDVARVRNELTGRADPRVITRGPGKRPRVHDLRHTFAYWAIRANTPLPVIQRQMGHKSITTTIDTYGHLARSDFDALAAAVSVNLPVVNDRGPRATQLVPPAI